MANELIKTKIVKEKSIKGISKSKVIISLFLTFAIVLIELLISNIIVRILAALGLVGYVLYLLITYNKIKNIQKDARKKHREIIEKIRILEQNKEKQELELEKIESKYYKELEIIKNETKIQL